MRVQTVRFGVRTAGTTFEGEGFRRTGASDGASVRRRRASNLLDIAARLSEFRRAAANGSTDGAKVMLSRDFRPDRARRRFVVRAVRGSGSPPLLQLLHDTHIWRCAVKEMDAIEFSRAHKTSC